MDELGWRSGGILSNIAVSIFAWITQLNEVSFLAVTSTEYLCATVMLSKSIGDCCTSVFQKKQKKNKKNFAISAHFLLVPLPSKKEEIKQQKDNDGDEK
jgi:hypothetical protein